MMNSTVLHNMRKNADAEVTDANGNREVGRMASEGIWYQPALRSGVVYMSTGSNKATDLVKRTDLVNAAIRLEVLKSDFGDDQAWWWAGVSHCACSVGLTRPALRALCSIAQATPG